MDRKEMIVVRGPSIREDNTGAAAGNQPSTMDGFSGEMEPALGDARPKSVTRESMVPRYAVAGRSDALFRLQLAESEPWPMLFYYYHRAILASCKLGRADIIFIPGRLMSTESSVPYAVINGWRFKSPEPGTGSIRGSSGMAEDVASNKHRAERIYFDCIVKPRTWLLGEKRQQGGPPWIQIQVRRVQASGEKTDGGTPVRN
ncbi:hypothetical protein PVAR5_1991 [Paecilomyces variotii No. 5]|uniref:Uncharacterized protein n=1 Tax=Byssochlamys spectabilis (strain No. 5 / NBRC 109023) TaxID=1356009 RepID=V5FUM5_BYSSN|nr:hypothetical protein PVAR5_1991 [Paecilomyces variotii No. 5]